ncbi:hypothetical protein MTBBW1_2030030 [Desulfamplus magnetovallimortis]|uniref:Uncharacterized protein n=1 Tax=Desulfamplus magnetovallimortis TaxID=1246637 RepID=A0A1W1HBT2_9BACT|nr:hypothetical protein [Desulfamplus magnetovallimortis]SLM29940.1 hypothetical protein MTBBW1_2030030 [Desulfamplus magnetovallimortis]
MMKSRRDTQLDSFELLLDTMCNTFGGIVFIALLIVILSQAVDATHPDNTEEQQPSPAASSFETSLASRVALLPESERKNRLIPIIDNMETLQQSMGLNAKQINISNALGEERKRIKAIKSKVDTLEKEMDSINREIDSLENQKKRMVRLPRLHAVNKLPVFVIVKSGKFYPITDISTPFRGSRGYDLSHVRMTEKLFATIVEPIPSMGQHIEDGSDKRGLLRAALTNLEPKSEFISFAVYPDSYGEFHQIKSLFIKHGFEYNWLPINDKLSIVKRGSGESHHAQ